ncbi:MAG: CRISPR system precrRNA processing endoribonuclease RAMP protein Cas6, partial [Syntrophobacteraceae bacterium]
MQSGRPNLPQPFVFDPVIGGNYGPGEFLVISFRLIGKAINFFPFMACALSLMSGREMGLGGRRVVLEGIVDGFAGEKGGESLIFDAESSQLTGSCRVFDFECVRDWVQDKVGPHEGFRKVHLNFLTPFRYKVKGRLGVPLNFKIFINRLLDRLTFLSVHSPISFDLNREYFNSLAGDIREVSELEWFEFRRETSSRYHKRPINLDGYVGGITFSGNLAPVMPYLKIGEFLNVGKAASFGHGKYELTVLEDGHNPLLMPISGL